MTNAQDSAPTDRLLLGRQPILDSREALIGYELLFRNSESGSASDTKPGLASAEVVCNAFTEFGLAGVLDGYKAFIIADAEFLRHEAIEALPVKSVVFEVDAGLAASPEAVNRCRELGRSGYAFCLDQSNVVAGSEGASVLLKQAMFIKLNVRAFDDDTLRRHLDIAAKQRPVSIASHVETPADHQRAVALGFNLFQGCYFAAPTLVEGRKIDPALSNVIHILHLLNSDVDIPEIERAFKNEAALTVKLLRLINSAGIGLPVRISSVRHAISIIGRRRLQRWLQLLMFSRQNGSDLRQNPLMQLAAFKGTFMERLAQYSYPEEPALPDLAFLAGLMSLMPAALGLPMASILDQIAVVPPLRVALLDRSGKIGVLLDLTDCYDNDDPAGAERALARLGNRIGRETLNQCLADSMAWAQSLTADAA